MPRKKQPQTVPERWRELAAEQGLTSTEMLTVYGLSVLLDDDGQGSPSYHDLGKVTMLKRTAVKEAVKSLRDKGLLHVTERRQDYKKHRTNEYVALVPQPRLPVVCPSCGRVNDRGEWLDEMTQACGFCGFAP